MPKYLLLYRADQTAREQMADTTPEQAEAGMQLWMQWAQKVGPALVDMGTPVVTTATVGAEAGGERSIAGFSVLEADSTDAATALLDGHPHLMMDGASIEVLEWLPLPGM